MPCRELGKSGLKVSAIGLGCMGMSHAYGAPADKKEMTELLARAVDMGYTFFDTAEAYGTHGCPHDNEELLGKALAPYRDKIVIATKFGIRFSGTAGTGPSPLITDSRPGTIRQSVEGSLKRLGVERIGLYYQHRMDDSVPPEEVAGVMQELIREGKIAHWGISEATEEAIRRAHGTCPITAVQNRYSMMARHHESLFPVLEELGIGFVAFSPWPTACFPAATTRIPHLSRGRTTAAPCLSSDRKALTPTRISSSCSAIWRKKNRPLRHKFPWRGCSAKSPGSFPFRGHESSPD